MEKLPKEIVIGNTEFNESINDHGEKENTYCFNNGWRIIFTEVSTSDADGNECNFVEADVCHYVDEYTLKHRDDQGKYIVIKNREEMLGLLATVSEYPDTDFIKQVNYCKNLQRMHLYARQTYDKSTNTSNKLKAIELYIKTGELIKTTPTFYDETLLP